MRRIDSPANALLKEIRELGKKAKKRREEGYFVGEGERLLRDLPLSSLVQIFLGEDYRGELPHFQYGKSAGDCGKAEDPDGKEGGGRFFSST